MFYETAFIVLADDNNDNYLKLKQENHAADIGKAIGNTIGFDKIEGSENSFAEHYILKVAAFKYKEWLNFRNALKSYLELPNRTIVTDLIMIGKLLKELETR